MDPERSSSLEEEVGSSDEDYHPKQQNKPSEAASVENNDDSEEDRVSGTHSDDHQPSEAAAALEKGEDNDGSESDEEGDDDEEEDLNLEQQIKPTTSNPPPPSLPTLTSAAAAKADEDDYEEEGNDNSGSEEDEDDKDDESSDEDDSKNKPKLKAKQNKPPHFVNPKQATMEEKEGNDDKEEKGEDVEEIDDDSGSFSSSSSDGSDDSHAHPGKTAPYCTPISTASKTRHGEEEDDDSGSREEEKEEEEVDEANEVQQIKNKKKPSLPSSAGGGDPLTSIASKVIHKEKLFDVKKSKLAFDQSNLHKPKGNKLWSSEDKVAILEGLIRFRENEGYYPSGKLMTDFHEFIRNSITPGLNQKQLSNKIKKLKDMYHSHAQKGKGIFSTNLDLKCFELSKTIWANNNVVFPKTGSYNGKRKLVGNIARVKCSNNTSIESESLDRKVFWDKFPCFQAAMDLELYGMSQVEKNVEMEAMMKIGTAKARKMEEKLKSVRAKKIQMSMQQQDLDRESQDVHREIKRMRLSFM